MVPDRQKVWTDGMDGGTQPKLYPSDFVGDNKSTAGMQHTPPWNIFNAKKITLKVDLFMQFSLRKLVKK